jgi:hypothetical protein
MARLLTHLIPAITLVEALLAQPMPLAAESSLLLLAAMVVAASVFQRRSAHYLDSSQLTTVLHAGLVRTTPQLVQYRALSPSIWNL